ncbi:MAG TPA: S8 family serine peptidase [Chloroflexia bacterium]|nr:S8 family serine peptidase [Chloroflexia bacterium]
MKKSLGVAVVLLMNILLLSWGGVSASASLVQVNTSAIPNEVLSPALASSLKAQPAGQMATYIVNLKDQLDVKKVSGKNRPDKRKNLILGLQNKSATTQSALRALLNSHKAQGHVSSYTPFWVYNAVSVTGDSVAISEIAKLPEIATIVPEAIISAPAKLAATAQTTTSVEPNISLINAPALWNLGYQGQGVVIASMDTGVDNTHPDLSGQYRGGTDSWYDPYGQHATPYDQNGHGTWTTGIMVGGSNSGSAIGVAPRAQWIAAKIFNDSNQATTTAIHQSFQWLLDPDGNPNTSDAPDVVNNSWAFGTANSCNLEFEPDLQSLVAADIVPVFSAGNYGPNASTSTSPANNPDAFSVGAIYNSGAILTDSSRGPNSCNSALFPNVVAPGDSINTTDLYGFYYNPSGTSFSAPHVSGAMALLLSYNHNLSVNQLESAMVNTAVDLGVAGPDNIYGAGRIDVLAAYSSLSGTGGSTPTPTPTVSTPVPTSTPTPTATATATPVPTNTPTPTATATPAPTNTPTPVATPTPVPTDTIFADGFESGSLSAWSSSSGGVSVTTAAAMAGSKFGLQAVTSNGSTAYVVDNSPTAEKNYHARFYFNPNGTGTGSSQQDILAGQDAATKTIFRIQYRRTGTSPNYSYQIRAGVLKSGGSTGYTNWYSITNTAHAIEIAWQSSKTASFTLYLDGTARQSLTGINTSTYSLESVRLGVSSGAGGGQEYFDAFVSTRSTYIGL